jgi:VanZ family protein
MTFGLMIHDFSSRPADVSTMQSTRMIRLINALIPFDSLKMDPDNQLNQWIIRKTAHFYIYFSLGFSTVMMIYSLSGFRVMPVLSAVNLLLYSVYDELFQMTVPGRTGKIEDVMLDLSGGLCAIIMVALFLKNLKTATVLTRPER